MANDISEIVLYDGSLAELNSIDPQKQYYIDPDNLEYYGPHTRFDSLCTTRRDLLTRGFDGLVNKRQYTTPTFEGHNEVGIQGTPIKSVIKRVEYKK